MYRYNCSRDKIYPRGLITAVIGEQWTVLFVDRGHQEIVHLSRVYKIDYDLLEQIVVVLLIKNGSGLY